MSLPNVEKQNALSLERLRDVLAYDAESGIFTRRTRNSGGGIGTVPGILTLGGYRRIVIDCMPFQAHRLAWFYFYGRWPALYLDHINGIRTDNRIANLREANFQQNLANRRAQNGRRLKGITLHRGKWLAQIMRDGRLLYLGRYETPEQAAAVYAAKAKEIHGEFARAP